MCMVLYLGSEKTLPIVPYNPEQPAFHTKELDEHEKPMRQHFSKPQVLYIGSSEGCGCSFRHALYDKGEWSYVVSEKEEEAVASQVDHQALVDYLSAQRLHKVEIYACWDGDYALPADVRRKFLLMIYYTPASFLRRELTI